METNGYRAVYEGGQGEIVEKKSRFIATVLPIETEEEALEFIAKMKKKYWDARHNCYAYVIGERQELQRCSDDGEPNGTAGRPMLDVLLHEDIHNTVVVDPLFWRCAFRNRRTGACLSKGDPERIGVQCYYREATWHVWKYRNRL